MGASRVGGRLPDAPSDPARRAARRARAAGRARLGRVARRARAPARARTPTTPSGRWTCCATSSTRRRFACSRRISPAGSRSSGSPIICRRWPTSCSRDARARAGRRCAGADARAAALRDHRLRQARRQGAGLRVRPRPRVPLRRRRATTPRAGALRAPRAAAQHVAHQHDGRRAGSTTPTCGCAPTARRACSCRRFAGVSPLPARAGVDLGAPGADARALRRRRRARSARRSRPSARRSCACRAIAATLARRRRRDAPPDARRPSESARRSST